MYRYSYKCMYIYRTCVLRSAAPLTSHGSAGQRRWRSPHRAKAEHTSVCSASSWPNEHCAPPATASAASRLRLYTHIKRFSSDPGRKVRHLSKPG